MADLSPEDWLERLFRCHNAELAELRALNAYYEGQQPLSYMHPELLAEVGDRLRPVVLNWPRLVVDAVEERLDVEGFRLPDADEADSELWKVWQANNLDEWSQQGHLDALVMRRAYVSVGSNEDDEDTPIVALESPLQMYAHTDPRTGKVVSAVKRWSELYPERDAAQYADHATLYLPNETVWYSRGQGATGWVVDDRDVHMLGEVPVAPLVNRRRLLVPAGTSELSDIIPISDAACKIATDMMVSAEFHAMPRRWALGFDDDDFTDEDGNQVSAWQQIAGRVWRTAKTRTEDGVEVGTFPEADLKNFHETLNQLARLVSSLSGMPPHYMGFTSDNPASADAIRSSEARLVKRAERKQRGFGGSWEQVGRLVNRFQTGDWDPAYKQLETLWREASTPTFAQKADATVKLVQAGIIPNEAAWEDLGYSAAKQRRMREVLEDQASREARALLAVPQEPPVDPSAPDETLPDASVGA